MNQNVLAKPHFRIMGDRGLLVEYGDVIDLEVNQKVHAAARVLKADAPAGLCEIIPAYRSLLVLYDPLQTNPRILKQIIEGLDERLGAMKMPAARTIEIPVCYGGDFGPDIGFVARHNRLSEEDVIRLHSQPLYTIFMIGFSPGYPYLGVLPAALQTPRLKTPRKAVPQGSVAIAGGQTGIYAQQTPGGWRIIGRTPLRLFYPERAEPFLYQAGDRIRFRAISSSAYRQMAQPAEERP